MSSTVTTFVDEVLAGRAVLSDIHDYIDAWHDGTSALTLHEFLGMTLPEFEAWVVDPSRLRAIIESHR